MSKNEQCCLEDTIASIRLRVNHHDAYEEWEKETRRNAFVRREFLFPPSSADLHISSGQRVSNTTKIYVVFEIPKPSYARRRPPDKMLFTLSN